MKVVIFCGGLGVRMGEAAERIPKPMVPVGIRPFLAHHALVRPLGAQDFILCLGYRAESSSSISSSTTRPSRTTSCSPAGGRVARKGDGRLADHVPRHGFTGVDRRSARRGAAIHRRTTRYSSAPTGTA